MIKSKEIDGGDLDEVTDNVLQKYWKIHHQKKRKEMLDYISKNKPIARLLKCKINTEFKADGLA